MFAALRTRAGARVCTTLVLVTAVAAGLLVTPRLTPTAAAAPSDSATVARSWAGKMLVWLNAERAAHGRTPLRMNAKLARSAHRHNLAMAGVHTMSHQLPGEPYFATRIEDAGYNYVWAGENIGYNTAETLRGLRVLQLAMYHEKAPDNGHRLNILSRNYRQVGIDVYFDGRGTMWFTQDFGSLS